ncbi:MAG: 16S rRNA (guanine(966)-N(2))-methyltransferase RsmD [Ardenticatenaceae bacterium]|nr:16S rRNA (guanine(966)-N(2))-methyltransferase RsmD [Ardenticatenaceae bacterium]
MRVISGSAKGRKLKLVPGDSTRPIMDRVKENLFNIIGSWVVGTRWLDLFAGTGQVGIEALSRGAAEVVFIDTIRVAIKIIEANLRHTRLTAGAEIVQTDAFDYLRRQRIRPFDVIYVAPPQYKGIWREVMELLDERPSALLTEDGIVVVQIDPREYETLDLQNLALYDQRRYGSTQLCFYEQTAKG